MALNPPWRAYTSLRARSIGMWHVQAHTAHVTCEQHSELYTYLPSLLALTLHPAHCTHCTHPPLFRPPSPLPLSLPACPPACLLQG